jgi:hypothetical protein
MGTESIMYMLVGTWWIVGTVYFDLSPVEDMLGTKPLGNVVSDIVPLPHVIRMA